MVIKSSQIAMYAAAFIVCGATASLLSKPIGNARVASGFSEPATLEFVCFSGTNRTGLPGCNKLPSSLPCVDVASPDDLGWAPAFGTNCGYARIIWTFWVIPCGGPSAGASCI